MLDRRLESPNWSLRLAYGLVPLVAGIDKFFNLLTYWPKYLSEVTTDVLPVAPQTFMYAVGVIEILAGILVLSPYARAGAYVVGAWLIAIAANLVLGGWYDIAVRDLVMSIGAFALARMNEVREPEVVRRQRVPSTSPIGSPAGASAQGAI